MFLVGGTVQGSASEYALVGGVATDVVVKRTVVVSAVVELFGIDGFRLLPNILFLSLPPKSLSHGIFPRIILEAVVVVVVVKVVDSLFVVSNESTVGS